MNVLIENGKIICKRKIFTYRFIIGFFAVIVKEMFGGLQGRQAY